MDNLKTSAPEFYTGQAMWRARVKNSAVPMDEAGKALLLQACRIDTIAKAKYAQYMRRTASQEYLTHNKDQGEYYMDNFDQVGARTVKDCGEGWCTDTFGDNYAIGVVLCLTRNGMFTEDSEGKGRQVYLAGMRYSEWEGVTIHAGIFDTAYEAERYADQQAERDAERCRDEEEKYQAEYQREAAREALTLAKRELRTLLRDSRGIRRANPDQYDLEGRLPAPVAESVFATIRNSVRDYLEIIAEARNVIATI